MVPATMKIDYHLGQMSVVEKLWTNWNKAPMRLW